MLSVLFGIASIVLGILWIIMWGAWKHFVVVLQGGLPPFLILVGLVAIAAGFSSMKDSAASKEEEDSIEDAAVSAPAPRAEEPAAPVEEAETEMEEE